MRYYSIEEGVCLEGSEVMTLDCSPEITQRYLETRGQMYGIAKYKENFCLTRIERVFRICLIDLGQGCSE